MSRAELEALFIEEPQMSAFARGFFLGALYGHGTAITTALIRRLCKVSRPTAKRDMREIAALAALADVLIEAPPGRARVAQKKKKPA